MIDITKVGKILIGAGLIMILTGVSARSRLPVLRGDVSEQRPIEAEDLRTSKGTVSMQGKRLVIVGVAILIIGVLLVILVDAGFLATF